MINRTRRLLSAVTLVALFTVSFFYHSFSAEVVATPTPAPPSDSPIGTNLSEVVDWTTELPFVDLFKTARQWVPQCTSADPGCDTTKWSTGEEPQLNLDPNGWVKSIPSRNDAPVYTFVSTVFLVGDTRLNYGGKYLVLYEGEGRIEYDYGATKDSASRTGRDVINVTGNGFVRLMIKETNPNNYIRNIHVIRPEYEESYDTQLFDDRFIARLNDFSVLRFMDWMRTNNSTQQLWEYRPTTELATYTTPKGVPLEVMLELANRTGKYPWFNMPHLADDNYVRQFAEIVRDNLNPNLVLYVEHSNEVWNSAFAQYSYALQRGQAEFRSGTNFDRVLNWHGRRTAEMCDLWKTVFKGQEQRLRCVAGSQAASSDASEKILSCPLWSGSPCSDHGIDALAIAPYFGHYLGAPTYQTQIEAWTREPDGGLNSLFTELTNGGKLQQVARSADDSADLWAMASASRYHLPLPNTSEPERSAENILNNTPPADGALQNSFLNMSNSKTVANRHGVLMIAYEGGQHLVGYGGVENNDAITTLFQNANRDPRMGDLYNSYFNEWKQQGGQLLTHFSLATNYTKWGSWGMLEYITQSGSPKYNAIINFINTNRCWWDCLLPTVTPTPTTTGTPTATSTPTSTSTPTPTLTPSTTPTPSATPTGTILPTIPPTATPLPSSTPLPSGTSLPSGTPRPSNTPPPGTTYTPIPTQSPIPTIPPTPTITRTPVPTLPPYFTPTPLPLPTIDENLIIYETITPVPITINGEVFIYDAVSHSEMRQDQGNWSATVTLYILDQKQQPIPKAIVTGRWVEGRVEAGNCLSDLNGFCTVTIDALSSQRDRATFQVNAIILPPLTSGETFDPIIQTTSYTAYRDNAPLSVGLQKQQLRGEDQQTISILLAIISVLSIGTLAAQRKMKR